MTEPKTGGWDALPSEQKESYIYDELVAIELQKVDPVFSQSYIEAKARTTDTADRMRLDIKMFDRVGELRLEGKMRKPELLYQLAREVASLNVEELRKAVSDFSQSLENSDAK